MTTNPIDAVTTDAIDPELSADIVFEGRPATEANLALVQPDTEFLPPAARKSRAELDEMPSDLNMLGIGVLAGAANVIMQLALPAVGYGVYESKVDSGNLFKKPVKRARTTLSYLSVAANGTAADRKAYRRAVGKAHAQVRSDASSPVKYNAFDPKLQLWVAACLYKGIEDMYRIYDDPAKLTDDFYQRGAVLGTTLQMPLEMWPATREDFEIYWNETVAQLEIDEPVREHLLAIARLEFSGPIVSKLFGWFMEIFTIGFLPMEFRDKMGVKMSWWQNLIFNTHNKLARAILTRAPEPLREFPFNILLSEVRWRIRTGRPLI